ncbi:MAG: DNA repair protein RecO [Kofleriaceae bacterium]
MTLESLGLVLSTTPLGESDLVVTLLTEDHGKIAGVARGARRSRKRFAGALGFAVLSRFQLRPPRGELWTLEGADVVRVWSELAADLAAFAHAGYVLDLVRVMAPAEHADAELLALAIATFDGLTARGASAAGLRRFELALLDGAGSAPALAACVGCGTDDLARGATFDAARGGVVCASCSASGRSAGRPVAAATLTYLAAAAAADDPAALDAATDADTRAAARDLVLGFLEHTVGHPLRSVEFLGKLNAGLRRLT